MERSQRGAGGQVGCDRHEGPADISGGFGPRVTSKGSRAPFCYSFALVSVSEYFLPPLLTSSAAARLRFRSKTTVP